MNDTRTDFSEGMLVAKGLGKRVDAAGQSIDILHDISFSLAAGASLAIVGASGSGKSTLLSLLAGLDQPSHGDVLLAGQALGALDEDGRARVRGQYAGFVFQSFQLLPELSALENVMLPLELFGGKTSQAQLREKAQHWLQRVGLGSRMQHTPRTLSGGEQQRVALARAFATGPRILFADEPTGSLDSHTGQLVADLLFELNRETETTLVLVTHDETLAARCGQRLRIDAGRMTQWTGATA